MGFSREAFKKDYARLSAGMQKKVLLAHAFSQSAHLYIFDEH
jgi:ABC-type Mn2+/Zn2+ transport system ATPase subunit